MSDSVAIERMGIPSVTVVTEPFEAAALATAAALGMPDLPLVVIPHDYLSESEAEIQMKVGGVIGEILAALTRGGIA